MQSKREEIQLALFIGLALYADSQAFLFLQQKRENLAINEQGNPDACLDLMYFQCMLRLIECVFCIVKFYIYAITSYLQYYTNQESLYFFARVAKFIASSYVFYVFLINFYLK